MKCQSLSGFNLHEISKPIFWENKKNIINLSTSEFTQRVVKVKGQVYSSWDCFKGIPCRGLNHIFIPVSILHKSIAGCYWPIWVADGPITVCYRFIKNASWDIDS